MAAPAALRRLRLYHLLLAATAMAAYVTGEELGSVHGWVGYGVAALLLLRLALGLVSRGQWSLSRWLPRRSAPLGQTGLRHPAISRLLVLGILASVSTATVTGVMMDGGQTLTGQARPDGDRETGERDHGDDEEHDEASLSRWLVPSAAADEGEGEEREGEHEDGGPLGEIHEAASKLMLILVGVHVLYLLLFRSSLAQFMLFLPSRQQR